METLEREDLKKALRCRHFKQLGKEEVEELRSEINKKLEILEMTYGIKIRLGKIRYDSVSFKGTIMAELAQTSSGDSAEKFKWNQYCKMFGLSPNDYGKEITFPSGRFAGKIGKLCSIYPRSHKYPIVVRLPNGLLVKSHPNSIKSLLGK